MTKQRIETAVRNVKQTQRNRHAVIKSEVIKNATEFINFFLEGEAGHKSFVCIMSQQFCVTLPKTCARGKGGNSSCRLNRFL